MSQSPATWRAAQDRLVEYFPDQVPRARVLGALLRLQEDKRLAYFRDTPPVCKLALQTFAGLEGEASTPAQCSGS